MKEEIEETEIRIIGQNKKPDVPTHPSKWKWWLLAAMTVVAAIAVTWFFASRETEEEKTIEVVEGEDMGETTVYENETIAPLLEHAIQSTDTATIVIDTTINEIGVRLFIPVNMSPALAVGYDILDNTDGMYLMFQAADVRGDTKEIAGDFVLRGKRIAERRTRNGYCLITGDVVKIGVDTTDAMMNEAIGKEGDFFRQYALVDNGNVVTNTIMAESRRRGLCQMNGVTFVVESHDPLTFTKFSEILVAMGVENAVYLLGATSKTWCRDDEDIVTKQGDWENRSYENANFIVWRRS